MKQHNIVSRMVRGSIGSLRIFVGCLAVLLLAIFSLSQQGKDIVKADLVATDALATSTSTNTPTPTCTPTTPLNETFESGTLSTFTSVVTTCVPGGCGWVSDTTASHGGTRSAFALDQPYVTDLQLTLTNAMSIPANAVAPTLTFWHRYDFEPLFDGGVLETSINNGSSWQDAGANITFGGYNGTISSAYGSPIAGRQAWTGNANGTDFAQVTVNLLPYAGQSLRIRFRKATDDSSSNTGWWVDDVIINSTGACASPTATATATPPCSWSAGANYPIPVSDSAAVTIGSNIYVFGGYSNGSLTTTANKFEGSVWTPIAPLPTVQAAGAAVTDGTYAYILNGATTGGAVTPRLYRYDPATNTYATMTPPAVGTYGTTAIFLSGKIYRIAGDTATSGTGQTNTVEAYTVSTDSWSAVANYPLGVNFASAVPLGGVFFVAGGVTSAGSDTLTTTRYDPATNTWNDAAIADLPSTFRPHWGAASALLNGKWIFGPGGSGGTIVNTAIQWDPATNLWTSLPNALQARYRAAGATLSNAFFAIGGNFDAGTTDNQRLSCTGATPTATSTATLTPTNTATLTPTNTPTNTATPVFTATNTRTPSATNTFTPTSTNTATPTGTNTFTPTPSATNTSTPSATNTFTPTPAATNTFTPTPSVTNTPTPSATNTLTPTRTNTATATATNTFTPTPSVTNTATPSATNTFTPTPSATNTFSPTPSATNTVTPTATFFATDTPTNTPSATPTAPFVISGTITYGNAIPAGTRFVSNVLLSAAGSPNVSGTTGFPDGSYLLSGFGSGVYTVTPAKISGVTSISSFDAAKIAQHSSGPPNPQLNATQLIVADVSGNGSVTSFDAGMIAKFAVGPPFTPPGVGSTGTWRFTPASRNYASVTGSIAGENYTAFLMGEVSGNWTNTAARPIIDRNGPERSIAVVLPRVVTPADKQVVIPAAIQGAADKGIISYEFELKYDPSILQPLTEPVDLTGTVSRGLVAVTNASEPGLLRVVIYGAMPITENGILLNLRFLAVGLSGSVSPLIWERIMFNEGEPQVTTTDGQVIVSY